MDSVPHERTDTYTFYDPLTHNTVRKFHWAETKAIAVRERKGLKAMMDSYPCSEEGAEAFLTAYKDKYDGVHYWRLMEEDVPAVNFTVHRVNYEFLTTAPVCWVSKVKVWRGGNDWDEVWTFAPRPATVCGVELVPVVVAGITVPLPPHGGELRLKFYNDDLELLPPYGGEGRSIVLRWIQEHVRHHFVKLCVNCAHQRGDRENDSWEVVRYEVFNPRGTRNELFRQLAEAVFHPARLERMMAAYGDDWMERV